MSIHHPLPGPVAPLRPWESRDLAPRRAPATRRVEIAWTAPSGRVEEDARLVPCLPAFDDAFAALARGTLMATPRGPVAVEDLWPGDELRTAQGRTVRLRWRGATSVIARTASPEAAQDPAMARLTRIATDALGLGRPFQDLVLGPRARVVSRRAGVRLLTGRDAALIPAADLVDGVHAVDVAPLAPVETFHLLLDRHETLLANGVEVESHHPGPLHAFALRGDQLALYMACFPHLGDLLAFGEPALPRLRLRDLELFDAL